MFTCMFFLLEHRFCCPRFHCGTVRKWTVCHWRFWQDGPFIMGNWIPSCQCFEWPAVHADDYIGPLAKLLVVIHGFVKIKLTKPSFLLRALLGIWSMPPNTFAPRTLTPATCSSFTQALRNYRCTMPSNFCGHHTQKIYPTGNLRGSQR